MRRKVAYWQSAEVQPRAAQSWTHPVMLKTIKHNSTLLHLYVDYSSATTICNSSHVHLTFFSHKPETQSSKLTGNPPQIM